VHLKNLFKDIQSGHTNLTNCYSLQSVIHLSPPRGRLPNAKSIGWAIYAAGFAIWLFGYLSAGHAPVFDWVVATPWWISTCVPNREAELGLALMFASMVPIYWRAGREATVMRGDWPWLKGRAIGVKEQLFGADEQVRGQGQSD
jgi:hypothetical protein